MKNATIARILLAAAAVSTVGSFAGCLEWDAPPAGSYSEVLLVSEDGSQDVYAQALAERLTRPIDYYVEMEAPFSVTHVRAADLADAPAVKNIVVCGVASPVTSVGRYLVSQLGEAGAARVREGEASVFKRENLPSAGQLTLIVTASSGEELSEVIATGGDQVVETIESSCRLRLRDHLLKYEDKQIARKLRETYGFSVRMPNMYRLLDGKSGPPGVELLREGPARLLGVFWTDRDQAPGLADSTDLYRVRAEYVWERYDGDVMDSTRVEFGESRLGEYPAIRMSGYWSNSRALAGGYFETYFVHSGSSKLLWCVDLLAFAPGLPKHVQFRELRALAETFHEE